jgi:hypothetical protein
MPRPTTPQFEQDYLAFIARYAPGDDAVLARLEFVERLCDLIDRAAPDVQAMRVRDAGWIARLKNEEEMGGFVPWPAVG